MIIILIIDNQPHKVGYFFFTKTPTNHFHKQLAGEKKEKKKKERNVGKIPNDNKYPPKTQK